MVLQRQIPARPAGRGGEATSGTDVAGDSRADAFSAALTQEKRSAASERDQVDEPQETATEEDAELADGQPQADAGGSDEILNLLSGLMSSAAYSRDAKLGNGAPSAEAEVTGPDTTASEDATAMDDVAVPAANGRAAPRKVAGATGKDTPESAAPTLHDAAGQKPAAEAAGGLAKPVAVEAPAEGKPAPAAIGAQVSAAATAIAGQGAPQTKSATQPQDRHKDAAAAKDVLQALGMDRDAKQAETDIIKPRPRGANAGRQDPAADTRMDEIIGNKGGKVEVIETRRFMPAQNMSANAQLVTRSLAELGATAMAAQRAAPLQTTALAAAQSATQPAGQTLHTLKLQLNPASLGSVTAELRLSGDDLTVEIKVQTAEAYRHIKEDNQAILKALRAQGFGVEQISVQHVVGSERAGNQTAQQGFQGGQQNTGSGDAQSSGRESGRNSTGQQGSGTQGGQAHEQSSYAGSGAGRADGVYL